MEDLITPPALLTCRTCGLLKSKTEFYTGNRKCKRCVQRRKQYLRKETKKTFNEHNIPETMVCSHCRVIKLSNEFSRDQGRKTGLHPSCKTCVNARANGTFTKFDRLRNLLYNSKERANKYKIPHDIKLDWLVEQFGHLTHCPVLDIELNWAKPNGVLCYDSPSIDKVVPELGYVKGNVMVVSVMANAMKSNASPEVLRKFCEFHLERLKQDSPR